MIITRRLIMSRETVYTEYMRELAEALEDNGKAMMYSNFTTSSCSSCEIGDPKATDVNLERDTAIA